MTLHNCLIRGLLLVAGLLSIVACSGCAVFGSTLSSDAVDSRVVDVDTGLPIEGAVVVAHWELHRGSLAGDSLPCGAANVEEAVTDKDGKFHIPGWGPIRSACDMSSAYPFLFIFKSGYGYARVGNYLLPIKLKKYPDLDLSHVGIPSYEADFGSLNGYLADFIVYFPAECNWKKIPNTLRALMAQEKLFRAAGNPVGSIVSSLTQDDNDRGMQRIAPQCGSPKAFIEGLQKGN